MVFSGPIRPEQLTPEQVDLREICLVLDQTCRFKGCVREYWSVAAHSLYVEDLMLWAGQPALLRLKGLMHDFHEAYLIDVPRPYASDCQQLLQHVPHLDQVIHQALKIPLPTEAEARVIKHYDDLAMRAEGAWQAHPSLFPNGLDGVGMQPSRSYLGLGAGKRLFRRWHNTRKLALIDERIGTDV